MKRIIIFIVFSLFCNHIALAQEKVTLAYMDFPPYEFRQDGNPTGLMVEIVQTVFSRANIKLELKFLSFQEAYDQAKSGQINGIFNFYKTEERTKFFDYSEVIIKSPVTFFAKKNSQIKFLAMEDLAMLNVGILKDYPYTEELWVNPMFVSVEASNHSTNFKNILTNKIHLYPCDKLIGIYIVKKNKLEKKLEVLPNPLMAIEGYIGFTRKGCRKIIAKINPIITKMWESGEIDKDVNKYLSQISPALPSVISMD